VMVLGMARPQHRRPHPNLVRLPACHELAMSSLTLTHDARPTADPHKMRASAVSPGQGVLTFPIWHFDRFTRGDVAAMWRWLKTGDDPSNISETHVHPTPEPLRQARAGVLR
jgi:hypothetical protein